MNTQQMTGFLQRSCWLCLVLIGLMGCRSSSSSSNSNSNTTVRDSHQGEREYQAYLDRKRNSFIGKKVPSMALTTLDGQTVDPAAMGGKLVLLNFWFAACKPCITEIPSLNELQKKYKDNDLVVVSVSTDRRSVVERVAEKYEKSYIVVPEGKPLADKLKVVTFPTTFLIDRTGTIRDVFIGASADDATYTYSEIKPQIERLLAD